MKPRGRGCSGTTARWGGRRRRIRKNGAQGRREETPLNQSFTAPWDSDQAHSLSTSFGESVPPDPDDLAWWDTASIEFAKRLDATVWPRGAPWDRPVKPGNLDFWRVHAYALDRLDDLLDAILPDGEETPDAPTWIGTHPDRPIPVHVSLLTGRWDEPDTGQGGADLIGLVAHVAGLRQIEAARWLIDFLGIEERRHA